MKELEKAGYEPCKDYNKISLRKDSHVIIIEKPVIYKHKEDNTYFFVGSIKTEDAITESANLFKKFAPENPNEKKENKVEKIEEVPEEEEIDETDVNEDEIKQIMDQTHVERKEAIKALKDNKGDVVEAIMSLTGI